MPSQLERAASRFRRELLNNERAAASAMIRVYGAAWRRVSLRVDDLQRQIAEAQAAGGVISPAWFYQYNRAQTLQAQIEAELRRFGVYAAESTTGLQSRAVEAARRHSAELVDLAAGVRPVGIEVPFDVLPTQALQDLVGFAADGSPLREVFGEIGGGVADRVTDTMVSAVAAGLGPRETARLIRRQFGTGLARALTISRTETLRAYREASHRNYEANGDVLEGWVWLSSLGARTCAACWAMHGSFHRLDERLDDHPNGRCLVPGTVVSGPLATAFVSRHYEGDIITIRTTSGKLLSVTPNHPILTDRGWVGAQFLQAGNNVVCDSGSNWAATGMGPNEYQIPTLVEDIPGALNMDRLISMPCAPKDFHGDGVGSDIYVVRTYGFLRDSGDSALFEPFSDKSFGLGDVTWSLLPGLGDFAAMQESMLSAPGGLLGNRYAPLMLFGGGAFGQKTIRGGLVAAGYSFGSQTGGDYITGSIEPLGESVFRFSGQIGANNFLHRQNSFGAGGSPDLLANEPVSFGPATHEAASLESIRQSLVTSVESGGGILGTFAANVRLDRVLEVSVTAFSGHVYNLQTGVGWYNASGIITHNCTAIPNVKPWKALGYNIPDNRPVVERGSTVFARLTAAEQEQVLGKAAFAAFADGAVSLEQFATHKHSEEWGDTLSVASLRALLGPERALEYIRAIRVAK